jgi:hypothetical protein
MSDFKTKIVSEVIRITADGQMTREHMLGRAIISDFWTGYASPLASIAADLEAKGLFEPGTVPASAPVHYRCWAGPTNSAENTIATRLLVEKDSAAPNWANKAYGDAILRLDIGRPRRCIKVESQHTLQDAVDFIDMQDINADFVALEDNNVWIIQKTRNRKVTKNLMMFAKMRFK